MEIVYHRNEYKSIYLIYVSLVGADVAITVNANINDKNFFFIFSPLPPALVQLDLL